MGSKSKGGFFYPSRKGAGGATEWFVDDAWNSVINICKIYNHLIPTTARYRLVKGLDLSVGLNVVQSVSAKTEQCRLRKANYSSGRYSHDAVIKAVGWGWVNAD